MAVDPTSLVLGASPTCSFRSCLMASSLPLTAESACSSGPSDPLPASSWLPPPGRVASSRLQFRLVFVELGEASNMCCRAGPPLDPFPPGPRFAPPPKVGFPHPGLQRERNQESFHEARKWWRKGRNTGWPRSPPLSPRHGLPALGCLPLFFILLVRAWRSSSNCTLGGCMLTSSLSLASSVATAARSSALPTGSSSPPSGSPGPA